MSSCARSGCVFLALWFSCVFRYPLSAQDDLVLRRILYKLFHIQQSLDEHAQAIRDQNKALVGLRKEQQKHEKALEEARSEQAKTRGSVMKKEKKIKNAEKALEAQVGLLPVDAVQTPPDPSS